MGISLDSDRLREPAMPVKERKEYTTKPWKKLYIALQEQYSQYIKDTEDMRIELDKTVKENEELKRTCDPDLIRDLKIDMSELKTTIRVMMGINK